MEAISRYQHGLKMFSGSHLTVFAPEPPPTQRVPLAAIPGGGTDPSAIPVEALVLTDSSPRFHRLLTGLFSSGATAS